MDDYPFSMLITTLLLAANVWLGSRVSGARKRASLEAGSEHMYHSPEIYTKSDFMRVFRNHTNFHEHLTVFLPVFWLFAICYSDVIAALFGVGFLIGRVMYARNYPESHKRGFQLSFLSFLTLLLGVAAKAFYLILQKYLL